MLTKKPNAKILVDGGDPAETLRMKSLIGFVDGQTANPSLIAKNPAIQHLIASGHRLSSQGEEMFLLDSKCLCQVPMGEH